MQKAFLCAALAMGLTAGLMAGAARADVQEDVQMVFQSGATFSGLVTFSDDFSQALAVNGVLSGGGYGSDPINTIWNASVNYSSGAGNYSNFLVDGPQGSYNNFILLAVNASNPAQLQFTQDAAFAGDDNTVDYGDAMVSGSITQLSQVSSVPEASTLIQLAAGLGVLTWVTLRKSAREGRA